MFSVIIPVYNKANFIERAIISVLNQTYSNFELIIIDDGSTDCSKQKIEAILDPRIKYYFKKNAGVSSARNLGIQKAKFKYIAFLDADDIWLSNHLEKFYVLIGKYPLVDLYSSNYEIYDESDSSLLKENIQEEDRIFFINDYCKSLAKGKMKPCWTGATCINKDAISELGLFPLGVKRGEDLDMWLRFSRKGIVVSNIVTALYFKNTENNAMKNFKSVLESFPYEKWFEYNFIKSTYLFYYANLMLIDLSISAFNNGNKKEAISTLKKCRGYSYLLHRAFYMFKFNICKV